MSPVKRLSEAVSRINPGNFVLEVEENHIPAELRPIAIRLKETLAQLVERLTGKNRRPRTFPMSCEHHWPPC